MKPNYAKYNNIVDCGYGNLGVTYIRWCKAGTDAARDVDWSGLRGYVFTLVPTSRDEHGMIDYEVANYKDTQRVETRWTEEMGGYNDNSSIRRLEIEPMDPSDMVIHVVVDDDGESTIYVYNIGEAEANTMGSVSGNTYQIRDVLKACGLKWKNGEWRR